MWGLLRSVDERGKDVRIIAGPDPKCIPVSRHLPNVPVCQHGSPAWSCSLLQALS